MTLKSEKAMTGEKDSIITVRRTPDVTMCTQLIGGAVSVQKRMNDGTERLSVLWFVSLLW